MSVRNGARYISQSIESVILQTFTNWELIIVDNASTDETGELIKTYAKREMRIHLIFNKFDLGHSGGLNKGIEASSGEWIARIDADDVALPHRLERQVTFVRDNSQVIVTSCLAYYIDEIGIRVGKTYHDLTSPQEFRRYMETNDAIGLLHPGVLMKRQNIVAVGGYREIFGAANDIDLWNRVSELGGLILVQPEYLMEYRIHSNSIVSRDFFSARKSYEWARACMIARRSAKQEPDWDSFSATWDNVTAYQRINRSRKLYAKYYYRQSGQNFITKKTGKAFCQMVIAGLLQPTYVIRRFYKQMLP